MVQPQRMQFLNLWTNKLYVNVTSDFFNAIVLKVNLLFWNYLLTLFANGVDFANRYQTVDLYIFHTVLIYKSENISNGKSYHYKLQWLYGKKIFRLYIYVFWNGLPKFFYLNGVCISCEKMLSRYFNLHFASISFATNCPTICDLVLIFIRWWNKIYEKS